MKNRSLFALFVILIAFRDILSELWLSESSLVFAFAISAVTSLVSLAVLLAKGNFQTFFEKLNKPGVPMRALPLGILSAFIYGLGYFLVKRVGAGLFNVIDYGLTPLATLMIGKLFFAEKLQKGFGISLLLYICGVGLLNFNRGMSGMTYLLLILIIPIAVSFSDALTKWLLTPNKGGLNKEELLVVRFLPGSIAILFIFILTGTKIAVVAPIPLLTVSLLCGWLPLWILCSALNQGNLSELAYWELLIPGLAFFGTLPFHIDDNFHFLPVLGAIAILLSNQWCQFPFKLKRKASS